MAKQTDIRDQEFVIEAIHKATGFPRHEIDTLIHIESAGWKWDAVNPVSGAEGLIQIMPFIRRKWGVAAGEIAGSPPREQLKYILRFFREGKLKGRWRFPGDAYLAVAAPAFIGKPDETVAYKKGSLAWKQNPGWRPPGGGDITAGSIRALLKRKMRRRRRVLRRERVVEVLPKDAEQPGVGPPVAKRTHSVPAWGWAVLMLALAAGLDGD